MAQAYGASTCCAAIEIGSFHNIVDKDYANIGGIVSGYPDVKVFFAFTANQNNAEKCLERNGFKCVGEGTAKKHYSRKPVKMWVLFREEEKK